MQGSTTTLAVPESKAFREVEQILYDIGYRGMNLEELAERYNDEHKKFVAMRFRDWPRLQEMLIGIDLPSEGRILDRSTVRDAYDSLQDDRRPGC